MKQHLLTALLLCALFMPTAPAQATQGNIVGTVRDESAAVIPGVTISVVSIGTGQIRTAITNDTGSYFVAQLPPAEYEVAAELAGFRRESIRRIVRQVGQTARVDITLRVGEVSQEVLVRSESPVVQSEESSLGTVIEEKRVSDLPLNGRDFAQLAVLTPGAVLRPSQSRNFSRKPYCPRYATVKDRMAAGRRQQYRAALRGRCLDSLD